VIDKEAFVLPPGLAVGAPAGGTLAEIPGDWVLPVAAPPPAPAVPRFALQIETKDGPKILDLPQGEHVLGRAEDCDLPIDDHGLSRRHAKLVVDQERVCVVDLGSTNQTQLAGKRVFPDDVVPVEPGAELVFGAVKAVVIRR
jgi:pSer/pThr/pTyr-binding forkhead associated (FHA) protein